MPKRRRVLAGLGQGLADASSMLLGQKINEQAQIRADERAERVNRITQVLPMLAENQITIDQLAGLFSEEDIAALGQLAPSNARKLPRVLDRFATIQNPEELSDDRVLAELVGADIDLGIPGVSGSPFEPSPELFAARGAASARQEALLSNLPERQIPGVIGVDGNEVTVFEPGRLSRGQTQPQTYRTERTAGEEAEREADRLLKEAGLGVPTLRGKATAEELLAGPLSEQVQQAGARGTSLESYAARSAQIRADLDYSQQTLAATMAELRARIPIEIEAARLQDVMQAVGEAEQSANQALPAVAELRTAWLDAEAEIAKYGQGISGRMVQALTAGVFGPEEQAAVAEKILPDLALSANWRRYRQLSNSMEPLLARAFGQRGNLTEIEQERAGLLAPTALDYFAGTAEEKLARLEAFFSLAPEFAMLEAGPDRADIIRQRLDEEIQLRIDRGEASGGGQAPGAAAAPAGTGVDPGIDDAIDAILQER